MDALQKITGVEGCRRFSHGLAALALAWSGSALAQDVVSVPAAHLQHAEGSVAYAPQGDKEWHDVQPRRLLKRGDRLWTDRGSRAEVQAGGHAVRLDGESQIVLENVGESSTQLSLTQGAMAATVTHMNPGDSFEVGTPNLAFRARQPGDYRIDVDPRQGVTRIVVQSGSAVVYGEKGEALEVKNGQRVTFRARDLTRVPTAAFAATDDFDKWTLARRRGEPTVIMPAVAQTPAAPSAPRSQFVNKGPDIVISGPASSLPGSRLAPQAQAVSAKSAPVAPVAPVEKAQPLPTPPVARAQPLPIAPVAKAQALPNVATNAPAAAPLRVTAPGTAMASALPSLAIKAEAEARARAQAEAAAQAAQAAREQQERERAAQARAEEERKAAAKLEADRRAIAAAQAQRADSERRAVEAKRAESERRAEAKRAEKRAVAAKKAEEERRAAAAQARREQEQKRYAAAKRAEEERRAAIAAKKAAEERKVAAAKKAVEERRIAEARRQQLARLQEQARRDEQSAQARRERRAEDERREEQVRREEQARRDEDLRRQQRALAEQARRDQQRRDEEVWLRQQQYFQPQPARPAPMGVPARRVS